MADLLEAQLQATLNMIPAHTWYAASSGALTFVNERCADYIGLAKDHPLRFGTDTGGGRDSHVLLLHPDDHEQRRNVLSNCLNTGSPGEVSFRVRDAHGNYAGSSVARSRSEAAMERSSTGSGSTSTSKNASEPSKSFETSSIRFRQSCGLRGLMAPMRT